MQISIIKPGMLTSIQDMGRRMHLADAVPVGGAMDKLAARIANIALGNDDNAAVIEFTYAEAAFKAETSLLVAYSGDGAVLKIDDQTLPADRPIFIPAGFVITLAPNPIGSRTYLAVAGGWDVPEVLDSRSTYLAASFGGFKGRVLKQGDILKCCCQPSELTRAIINKLEGTQIKYPGWSIARPLLSADKKDDIRIVPGNEFSWFDSDSILNFLSVPYTLSLRSNRMGYQLHGALINLKIKKELLSTAVTPGTIQVTGSGEMILLMADCQTTGGYPRIAQVAGVDMPVCAQLKPADSITFKEISREEAEKLYIELEVQLYRIRAILTYKIADI